ncbi:MAG: hypothetical protein ACFCUE_08775 [Candidatus Bathyarchaeia archaeon]|jgi:hypothetical protein
MVRRSVLDKIYREMISIRYRLDDLEKNISQWNPKPAEIPEMKLLLLPDHLRKTYTTVAVKGECDATIVSNVTGRCRAVESNYLNQLTRMGWLNKRRISKTISFRVVEFSPEEISMDQVKKA